MTGLSAAWKNSKKQINVQYLIRACMLEKHKEKNKRACTFIRYFRVFGKICVYTYSLHNVFEFLHTYSEVSNKRACTFSKSRLFYHPARSY